MLIQETKSQWQQIQTTQTPTLVIVLAFIFEADVVYH